MQRPTYLSNLEQFVGVPSDDAARKSTPAPLHYAAQNLYNLSVVSAKTRPRKFTIGSMSISSFRTAKPMLSCHVPSYRDLKKVRMKLLEPTGSVPGRKGRRRKGMSSAVSCERHGRICASRQSMLTSRLHLLSTLVNQLHDFVWFDLLATPCFLPAGFGGSNRVVILVCKLPRLCGVAVPEPPHEGWHCGGRGCCLKRGSGGGRRQMR
jgi:hypothetical protein